jgi:GH25 family lysozyme M1 (1,4-beta-N-acetylmuramidase)
MVNPRRIDGIDISHYQSGALDFAKAKKAGVRFVYHKATQGTTYRDPAYASRRREVKKAGVAWGAYHFAMTTSTPGEQATHFLRVSHPLPGDMRPMLDLEDDPMNRSFFSHMSMRERTKWVAEFVAIVKKETGQPPFIYTPFDLTDHFDCPLWAARYSSKNEAPNIPLPWKTHTVWQFSNGVYGVPNIVAGIGHCDLNTVNMLPREFVPTFSLPEEKEAPAKPKHKAPAKPKPKPAPEPTTSLTLKVGTANIQNFPDLTDRQVRQDVAKIKRAGVDLVLFQEIGERSDFLAIVDTLGPGYGVTDTASKPGGYRGNNVIAWQRHSPLVSDGKEAFLKMIGPGMGPRTHTPSQWMVRKTFKSSIGVIDAYDIHFIQGAYSKPGQPGDADGRRKAAWQENWNELRKAVLESVRAGHIAIFGGDWNRRKEDIRPFARGQHWIVTGGKGGDGHKNIDHVGILLPPGVKLQKPGVTISVALNFDHDLHYATVILTKK